MAIELKKAGVLVAAQHAIRVKYDGQVVGEYCADLLVEGKIILEIKAAKHLAVEHEAQLLNYLRATDTEVGLFLNFGPKAEVKRKVFDNRLKS